MFYLKVHVQCSKSEASILKLNLRLNSQLPSKIYSLSLALQIELSSELDLIFIGIIHRSWKPLTVNRRVSYIFGQTAIFHVSFSIERRGNLNGPISFPCISSATFLPFATILDIYVTHEKKVTHHGWRHFQHQVSFCKQDQPAKSIDHRSGDCMPYRSYRLVPILGRNIIVSRVNRTNGIKTRNRTPSRFPATVKATWITLCALTTLSTLGHIYPGTSCTTWRRYPWSVRYKN